METLNSDDVIIKFEAKNIVDIHGLIHLYTDALTKNADIQERIKQSILTNVEQLKHKMKIAASELSHQQTVDDADFSIYCDKLYSIFMEGLGKSFYQKVTGEVYAKLSSVSTLNVTPRVIRNQTETSGAKYVNPVPASEDSGTFLIGGHYRTKNPSKRKTDVGRIIILDHINNSFGQLRYTICTENEITTVDAKMITAEYEFDPDTNNGIVSVSYTHLTLPTKA